MKKQHTYERLIGQKLNGLIGPNIDGLWATMEALLNREMPQQSESKHRNRPLWFSTNILLAALVLATGTAVYVWNKSAVKETNASPRQPSVIASSTSLASKKEAATSPSFKPTNGAAAITAAAAKELKGSNGYKAMQNRFGSFVKKQVENKVNFSISQNDGGAKNTTVFEDDHSVKKIELTTAGQEKITLSQAPTLTKEKLVSALCAIQANELVPGNKSSVRNGFVFGFELSHLVAIDKQRSSGLDLGGKENQWRDYIPAVYVQFHLGKNVYLQTAWSPVATQYTPNHTLYYNADVSNPEVREERTIRLEKLFYTNIPLSVYYNTPWKGISVGAGLQYSPLKKIVLHDQEYDYLIGSTHGDVSLKKNEFVIKDPVTARQNSSGDASDLVAASFRKDDWRLMADVNYGYRSLHGGLRFTSSLNPYINGNFTGTQIKDRNEALQLYLSYNIFSTRKK